MTDAERRRAGEVAVYGAVSGIIDRIDDGQSLEEIRAALIAYRARLSKRISAWKGGFRHGEISHGGNS